jgi:hypothetical protein
LIDGAQEEGMRGALMTVKLAIVLLFLLVQGATKVLAEPLQSDGQTVYVPVYSHIYSGNRERPFDLAVTLSIRNTDLNKSISLAAVDYYDSDGKLVKQYLESSQLLGPMASIRYVVKESDTSGGSGANFVVKWNAETSVNQPVIESVMIGTQSQQGISFTSRGQIISE